MIQKPLYRNNFPYHNSVSVAIILGMHLSWVLPAGRDGCFFS